MKNIIVSIAFLAISGSANAALSPYWDSVKQIEVVMNSPELSGKLIGTITVIKNLGDLKYEVNTELCTAQVVLEAHVPNHPGPTTYSLKSVENVDCE